MVASDFCLLSLTPSSLTLASSRTTLPALLYKSSARRFAQWPARAAEYGLRRAARTSSPLEHGLNVYEGVEDEKFQTSS